MGFTIRNIVFDCKDPYGLAMFWSNVFGYPIDHDDRPDNTIAVIVFPSGPMLYFEQVPEPKLVKNRVHLCLQPDDLREVAVQQVVDLGGSIVADLVTPTAQAGSCSPTLKATSALCAAEPA